MYNSFIRTTTLSVYVVLNMFALQANAQALESIKSQEELNKVIGVLDGELFDSYNRCDLGKYFQLLRR